MSRPRKDANFAMQVYTIRLGPKQARMARRLGDGNLSEGIRLAIDSWEEYERNRPTINTVTVARPK